MMTSGAPFFAEIAVWNFAYSGWPWPALVQQAWTSVCWLLKLSTTLAMFGYQAQTRTFLASSWTILLVQLVALAAVPPLPLDESSPPPQPARPNARTMGAMTERVVLKRIPGLLESAAHPRIGIKRAADITGCHDQLEGGRAIWVDAEGRGSSPLAGDV